MGVMLVGMLYHVATLQKCLGVSVAEKNYNRILFDHVRGVFARNPQACFAGIDHTSVSSRYNLWTPLLFDVSCGERPAAMPLYLTRYNGGPALTSIEITTQTGAMQELIPAGDRPVRNVEEFTTVFTYGAPVEFTLENTAGFDVIVPNESGELRGFRVDNNMVLPLGLIEFTPLFWDPGRNKMSYRLVFTSSEVLLLANGLIMSAIPLETSLVGTLAKVQIVSRNVSKQLGLRSFRVGKPSGPAMVSRIPELTNIAP
jgi:hypothetical protein